MTLTIVFILILVIATSFLCGFAFGIDKSNKRFIREIDQRFDPASLQTFEAMKDAEIAKLELLNARRDAFINRHKDRILYERKRLLQSGLPASELIWFLNEADYKEAKELQILILFGFELKPYPPKPHAQENQT